MFTWKCTFNTNINLSVRASAGYGRGQRLAPIYLTPPSVSSLCHNDSDAESGRSQDSHTCSVTNAPPGNVLTFARYVGGRERANMHTSIYGIHHVGVKATSGFLFGLCLVTTVMSVVNAEVREFDSSDFGLKVFRKRKELDVLGRLETITRTAASCPARPSLLCS